VNCNPFDAEGFQSSIWLQVRILSGTC